MKILKFGGAALKNIEGFKEMVNIVKHCDKPYVIIVSALRKISSSLVAASKIAEKCEFESSASEIMAITAWHRQLVQKLFDKNNRKYLLDYINQCEEELLSLTKGVSITCELTARTLDKIMSYGELMALEIANEYFKANDIEIIKEDSRELIITDSIHGRAIPDIKATKARLIRNIDKKLKENKSIIIQGFVAASPTGQTTTMGLESSNLTASILASILKAEEINIWTDVSGFRSADPKIFEMTNHIPSMSYRQASFIASCGFKLIYPNMIEYAKEQKIPIKYHSAFAPNAASSVISDDGDIGNKKILISKSDISAIQLEIKSQNIINDYNELYIFPQRQGMMVVCGDSNYINRNFRDYEKVEGLRLLNLINAELSDVSKIMDKSKTVKSELYLANYDHQSKLLSIVVARPLADILAEYIHSSLIMKL